MPEDPIAKPRLHPLHAALHAPDTLPLTGGYVELDVRSNFSFLTGASYPDELVEAAATLGHSAIAIADTHSLAGIVRAHVAAKRRGVQLIVGTRVYPTDAPGMALLLYPTDRPAYARLCRLLTLGKRRALKGHCTLTLADIREANEGLLALVVPPPNLDPACAATLSHLRDWFDEDRLSLSLARTYQQTDEQRARDIVALARHTRVPVVATNAVHYHVPERRPLQDILTCIRHRCTIEAAGWRLFANAERYLKPAEEMQRLFRHQPGAITRTLEIAARTQGFNLDQLRYEYPDEIVPTGTTPIGHLTSLTWAGAARRYPQGVPASVAAQIRHELTLIEDLRYAPYFLTVHEIVEFAVSKGILCQGRGAAANSAVCYCLGVT
ncbi:MAG: PHP domain-containing protein, partial [Phycisphaerales bacterium]